MHKYNVGAYMHSNKRLYKSSYLLINLRINKITNILINLHIKVKRLEPFGSGSSSKN